MVCAGFCSRPALTHLILLCLSCSCVSWRTGWVCLVRVEAVWHRPWRTFWPPTPVCNTTLRQYRRSWGDESRSWSHSGETGLCVCVSVLCMYMAVCLNNHVFFRLQAQREIQKLQAEVEKLQDIMATSNSKKNKMVTTSLMSHKHTYPQTALSF